MGTVVLFPIQSSPPPRDEWEPLFFSERMVPHGNRSKPITKSRKSSKTTTATIHSHKNTVKVANEQNASKIRIKCCWTQNAEKIVQEHTRETICTRLIHRTKLDNTINEVAARDRQWRKVRRNNGAQIKKMVRRTGRRMNDVKPVSGPTTARSADGSVETIRAQTVAIRVALRVVKTEPRVRTAAKKIRADNHHHTAN